MTQSTRRDTLLDLLEEATGNRPDIIDDATELRDGLGLDSVDLIALVMQVENYFNITIDSEEMPSLKTVGHVLDLLERKLPPGRAAA